MEAANRGVLDEEAMQRVAWSHERAASLQVGWADALTLLLGPCVERENGESAEAFALRRTRSIESTSKEVRAIEVQARALLDDALRAYETAPEGIL
jgi:hypothetical protein